jgi:hypothetical protein
LLISKLYTVYTETVDAVCTAALRLLAKIENTATLRLDKKAASQISKPISPPRTGT